MMDGAMRGLRSQLFISKHSEVSVMSDPRNYLINRFSSDAKSLRARSATLRDEAARGGSPGPDANASESMAAACDDVVAMLMESAPDKSVSVEIESLLQLLPRLKQLSATHSEVASVRAVYDGAAARIREIEAAERKAQESDGL